MSTAYTIVPNDNGAGGTFTPSSVILTPEAPSATFKYTAASSGTKTIKTGNSGGLVNPSSLSCLVNAGQLPGSATAEELMHSVPMTRTPIAALATGLGNFFDSQSMDPCIVVNPSDSTKLIMLFTGFGAPVGAGLQTIGRATANVSDPTTWTVSNGGSPVLTATLPYETAGQGVRADSMVYNSSDGKLYLFYTASESTFNATCALASSTDLGLTWTKLGQTLTPSGGEGTCSGQAVLMEGTTLHSVYSYRVSGSIFHYRYASATTANWLSWTKGGVDVYTDSPRDLEYHKLIKVGSTYLIVYESGSFSPGTDWEIRFAKSSSPSSTFTRSTNTPFFTKSGTAGAFDEFHVATPQVLVIGGFYYLFYCGALDHSYPVTDNHWQMGIVPLADSGFVPASAYTLSGPGSGTIGVTSTNFTVTLPVDAVGTVHITPSDGGGGGTFAPTSLALVASGSGTFTYTPTTSGTKTISVTNDGGLTDPASLTYSVFLPTLYDTFTGTSDLGGHVSETGHTWSGFFLGSPVGLKIAGGVVYDTASGGSDAITNYTPASADTEATITISKGVITGAPEVGMWLRFSIGTNNGYMGRYAEGLGYQFYRVDPGISYVQIGSNVAGSIADGDTLRFTVSGTGATVTLTLYKNGVSVATASDTSGSRVVVTGVIGVHCYDPIFAPGNYRIKDISSP